MEFWVMIRMNEAIGGKILLLEDDEKLSSLITSVLTKNGYLVQACTNGDEALRAMGLLKPHQDFQPFFPDMMLVDIGLPGMSGDEFVQVVSRSCPELSNIPYIVLSGQFVDKKDILKGLTSGAFDYLCKPVDFDILLARVNKAISTHRDLREKQDRSFTHDVFDIKDTAEFLRTSEKTIYSLVNGGKIPAKKIGGQWRLSKKSLLNMFV